jgi:hypothetical protein
LTAIESGVINRAIPYNISRQRRTRNMSEDDRLDIATEIASAAIANVPQYKIPADKPEELGAWAGKIFNAVYKEIASGEPPKGEPPKKVASKAIRF